MAEKSKQSLHGYVYSRIAFIDGDSRRPNGRLREVVGFAWRHLPGFSDKLVEVLEWGASITSRDLAADNGWYEGDTKQIIVANTLLQTVRRRGNPHSGPLEYQMAVGSNRSAQPSEPAESEGHALAAAILVHETEHAYQHSKQSGRERDIAQEIQDEVDAQRAGAYAWSVLRPHIDWEGSDHAKHLDRLVVLWRENRVHEYVMSHGSYQDLHLGRRIIG